MKAYTPPLCLWSLVKQHVSPHEQDEIKSMLGISLVEQSQELHKEIETLLEIWREMRDETSVSPSPQCSLPEPPDQRDRLVQEICFFVNNVKEKAEEKGIDPQFILKRHNSQILDYAVEINSRPGSSKIRISSASDGRETPVVPSTYTRDNLALKMADELKTVNKKLNYLEFDEVCESLRSALEREVGQLVEDIQFLQNCLDSEVDSRNIQTPQLISREPTLSELREERSQLEKELLATNKLTTTPQVVKPSFNANNIVLPSTSPVKSELSVQKTRPVPLRADHCITGGVNEIRSASSDIDLSLAVQTKDVQPKPPIAGSRQNSDGVNKTNVRYNVRTDKPARHVKMSGFIMNGPTTRSSAPNSPLHSPKKSDIDNCGINPNVTQTSQKVDEQNNAGKFSRKPLVTQTSQKVSGYSQPLSSTVLSATKHDNVAVTMGVVRRRTVSPGRVRVVELTTLVDTLSGREDSNAPSLSALSSSTTSTIINPSPPSSSLKINSTMSPSSAHAERFRNMVLGCRDGE